MAEALAVLGLISAIVQFIDFSSKVIARIDILRSKNNEAPAVFRDITVQLPLLMVDLRRTKDSVERHEVDLETQSTVLAVVQACHNHVISLDDILLKVSPEAADSSWRLAKKALLSIHQEDKIRFIAQELRNNVVYLTHHSASTTAQYASKISSVHAEEQLKMLQWLSITDPSLHHNRAIQQREPGSGQWLLQSDEFKRWESDSKSLGWLYGIPGCGKTILCAAIIEAVKPFCELSKSRVLAYYYIDFNDTSGANVGNLLRSLIKQICASMGEIPRAVQNLCSQHRASGQHPSTQSLVSILQDLEATQDLQIFVVIDAIDEFPEQRRAGLLDIIQSLAGRDFQNTHILVASRAEIDIKYTIGEIATEMICIQRDQVDADIRLYVKRCLSEDPRLNRLPDSVKHMVGHELGDGAQGMFRWAVCQIDALRNCNKVSAVKRVLADLPKSLYDTYERILTSINDTDLADARAIMQWIAFAKRPLAIEELAEAATSQPGLEEIDPDDKLYDPYDVLRICRSLVSLSEEKGFVCGKLEFRQVVRFAHASVREYLLSDHITRGSAASFALSEKQSHAQISQCCLSILLRNENEHRAKPAPEAMPLLKYAAQFWFGHFERSGSTDERSATHGAVTAEDFAVRLLTSVAAFQNWLVVYNPDLRRGSNRPPGIGSSSLYFSALLGLLGPTRTLLDLGYRAYEGALIAAASKGDESMVRLLVGKGADVNSFGGRMFANPLQAACYAGSESIVRLLLDKGAVIDGTILGVYQGEKHDTALMIASESGDANLVRLLIDSGAAVNAPGTGYGYPLQAAAARGHYAISAYLLDKGAQVNTRGGHYGTALQAAVSCRSERIVILLLEAGADPNIQAGGFRDALRAAAWRQEPSIFDLLIQWGADVSLSIRRLQGGKSSHSSKDPDLVEKIVAAKKEHSPMLMDLINSATKRISFIEKEARIAKRIKFNQARARKIIQYDFKMRSEPWLSYAQCTITGKTRVDALSSELLD